MKKLLIFIFGILFSVSSFAYTITFGNNASSATAITSTTKATTVISEGTEYVTYQPFTINSGNCYYGDTKTCIRIGKSGNSSSLTIALVDSCKIKASTIVINCNNIGGNKNTDATLSVNGSEDQVTTTTADDYVFSINDSITSITLVGSAAIRVYSITVNNVPTSITDININNSIKVLDNDQVIINNNGHKYNILGQPVK